MTKDEFAEAYAQRSNVTVEWLRQNGREARPCDCGDEICEGWQMAHVGAERELGYEWPEDSVYSMGDPRYRVRGNNNSP